MKALKIGALGVTAVAVMAAAAFSTPASPNNGADVINGLSCGIGLAPIGPGFVITTDTHSVVTPSGNTVFKCKAEIPAGLEPAKAVKVTGLGCFTPGGFTTNHMKVFTPGGQIMLTCQINGSN